MISGSNSLDLYYLKYCQPLIKQQKPPRPPVALGKTERILKTVKIIKPYVATSITTIIVKNYRKITKLLTEAVLVVVVVVFDNKYIVAVQLVVNNLIICADHRIINKGLSVVKTSIFLICTISATAALLIKTIMVVVIHSILAFYLALVGWHVKPDPGD